MGLFRKSQKSVQGGKSLGRTYVLKQPPAVESDTRDWTRDLATRKQLRYLAEFGASAPETLTKGQAGAMLDKLIAEFPKIEERHERAKANRAYDEREELKEELSEARRQFAAAKGAGNVLYWATQIESLKASLGGESGGCFKTLLWIGIAIVGGIILTRFIRPADSDNHPSRPALARTPLPAPQKPLAVQPAQRPTQFGEEAKAAQRRAVAAFPALGVKDSPLNREFLRRYAAYQHTQKEFFNDPEWPTKLAAESQRAIEQH